MVERTKFLLRCAIEGAKSVKRLWGAFLAIVAFLAVVGFIIPAHLADDVPAWIKAIVLTAAIVLIMLEGAYQLRGSRASPPPPAAPAAQAFYIYGDNPVINTLPNSGGAPPAVNVQRHADEQSPAGSTDPPAGAADSQ